MQKIRFIFNHIANICLSWVALIKIHEFPSVEIIASSLDFWWFQIKIVLYLEKSKKVDSFWWYIENLIHIYIRICTLAPSFLRQLIYDWLTLIGQSALITTNQIATNQTNKILWNYSRSSTICNRANKTASSFIWRISCRTFKKNLIF